tara:strand:- start:2188 stop:2526 length:339 start_codon:yes stop_codon:yes gene_type:complete
MSNITDCPSDESWGDRLKEKLVILGLIIVLVFFVGSPIIWGYRSIERDMFISDVQEQSEALEILFPSYTSCRSANPMADCLRASKDTASTLGYGADFASLREAAIEFERKYK